MRLRKNAPDPELVFDGKVKNEKAMKKMITSLSWLFEVLPEIYILSNY
jgi:hypothetical protein